MGDQSIPEVVEGPGEKVVGITRVEDASFESLCTMLKASLPNIIKYQVFPVGSVILISAPVELLRINVSTFLVLFHDFEKWL